MKEGSDKVPVGGPSLPRPELNPLTNPVLGRNLGRWAQVYFTSPPEQREQAVSQLVRELEAEPAAGQNHPLQSSTPAGSADPSPVLVSALREARDAVQPAVKTPDIECVNCNHTNEVENRFCGFCGGCLDGTGERPSGLPSIEIRSPAPAQDHELEWLRNKDLASFQVRQGRNFSWVKYALAVSAVVIAAILFIQSRGRVSSPVQTPTPAKASTQAPQNPAPEHALPDRGTDKRLIQSASLKKEQSRTIPQPGPKPDGRDTGDATPGSGDPDFRLAQTYLQNRNSPDAARLLWKAVRRNNTEAALSLSQLYARGEGVPKNCDQARLLLVAAAKRGSSAAAQQLRQFDSAICR